MQSFDAIYAAAAERKGGEDALESLLGKPKSPRALAKISDDRYLSEMTKAIFRAGFVWKVVENKWPGFEEAFSAFDPRAIAAKDDVEMERLASDPRVIRNRAKVFAVRDNAIFVLEIAGEAGSFGRWFSKWPSDDQVGLLEQLRKRGSRLGGMTAQYFVRFAGKDSFILSHSVVAALIGQGVVDKAPSSKRDLRAAQEAFNAWHAESGRSYTHISRVLAFSVPD